jgi:hypothetical protein
MVLVSILPATDYGIDGTSRSIRESMAFQGFQPSETRFPGRHRWQLDGNPAAGI